MTKSVEALPLQKWVAIHDIPERGLDVTLEASASECQAVATWLDVPGVPSLKAKFHLIRRGSQVRVDGAIEAVVTRLCVVTLEPFDVAMHEPVSVRFSEHASPDGAAEISVSHDAEEDDLPDPIQNGRIDLGAVTAEFLALGLDPHPRKPDAAFRYVEDASKDNPFAALAKLKGEKDSN